jgi:hypothetical protein
MLKATIAQEAAWAARDEVCTGGTWGGPQHDGKLRHAGDVLGRALGWSWRTDPDIFMQAVTDYAAILGTELGQTLTLDDLHDGLLRGMTATLDRSEAAAALSYAQEHWGDVPCSRL